MNQESDLDPDQTCLTACVTYIQWMLGTCQIENGELTIRGWAIPSNGAPATSARFLINGKDFERVEYPISSPELGLLFPNTSKAMNARFVCQTKIHEIESFDDGFACLQFVDAESSRADALQRAWYFPDPQQPLPMPDDERIRRVIGSADLSNFLIGGASIFKRFERYLVEKLGRTFSDFPRILDWGCGSGRVSRHLRSVQGAQLYGADIDADNIAWCNENLFPGRFSHIPLLPPTPFPDAFFDMVIGISVFTHLSEEKQFAWIGELKRITRRGAILMISVQGRSQMGLARTPTSIVRELEQKGFIVTGGNDQLDAVIVDKNYYINAIQSHDYIRKHWGDYFAVLDIVDAIAGNQDLVLMRNDI